MQQHMLELLIWNSFGNSKWKHTVVKKKIKLSNRLRQTLTIKEHMSVGKERCLNAFVRRKKQIKFAVCSRSVANQVYLTNHRSKNQKVIMHHTQGLEQYPPNETMSFPRSLQSAKIKCENSTMEKCVFESSLKNTETQHSMERQASTSPAGIQICGER